MPRADRWDEMDAVPEVVDVEAAELGVGGKGRQGVGPLVAEGVKVRLPDNVVRERLTRSAGDAAERPAPSSASPRWGGS